jgi:hypothetical protein
MMVMMVVCMYLCIYGVWTLGALLGVFLIDR